MAARAFRPAAALKRAVAERDNWTCQICLFSIDESLKNPHPFAANYDHWPTAYQDGGATVITNLRLTHRLCNLGWKPYDYRDSWTPKSLKYLTTESEYELFYQIRERLAERNKR